MADFPALFQGTESTLAPATPPLPHGYTLNGVQSPQKSVTKPPAVFDLSTMPGLPDGYTLGSNPSISNPKGTALGRALKRGVLRTRSALPAIQAQKGATVLSDAALAQPDLIRNVFLETTRLPDVPEGVDISTPELASAAITGLGYPADFANVFRQTFDIRARDAAAALGSEAEVAQTAISNVQAAQELNDRAAAIPNSPSAEQFKQILNAAPDTTLDVLKAYAQNPGTALAFLGETAAESLPQMGASAVTTLATRSPALGAAVLGGGTVVQEFGSGVNEFFAEHGVSPKTPEEAAALIRDPELMAAASRRGVGRGVVIALAEMAGQGAAAQQLFKGAVKEAGKDVVAQMATGAGGEAGARAATGQEMSPREIVTEALAEGVAAPVEVGATVYQSRKNARDAANAPEATPPAEIMAQQIPALPSGFVLDDGSAGQLRTSDVQPLEAPTKVPDATRQPRVKGRKAASQAAGTLGHAGRVEIQDRLYFSKDAQEQRTLQTKWSADMRLDLEARASHPKRERVETRISTEKLIQLLDDFDGLLLGKAPWSPEIEDRMNVLELHLAKDDLEAAEGTPAFDAMSDKVDAAQMRLWSTRVLDPYASVENKKVAAKNYKTLEALVKAKKDPVLRRKLREPNLAKEELEKLLDEVFGPAQ